MKWQTLFKLSTQSILLFGITAFSFNINFPLFHKKAEAEEQTRLENPYFKYAFKLIPHKDKRDKGGEDAYVASDQLLVVADGVGGWGELGVDPGLFSKELCTNIKKIFD